MFGVWCQLEGCRDEEWGSWRWGAGPRGGPCTIAKVLVMGTHLKVLQMGLAIAQILA